MKTSLYMRACSEQDGKACPRVIQPGRVVLLCVLSLLALSLLAVFGPHVAQSGSYHLFADDRDWHGLSNAANVLSNLPFLLGSLWILYAQIKSYTPVPPLWWKLALLCALGLIATSAGSSYYHLHPDDASLLWDRLGMVGVFAGMTGLALYDRVGNLAAVSGASSMLLGCMATLLWWHYTDNFLPWAVLQGAGMVLLLALAFVRSCRGKEEPSFSVAALIGCYALAKVCEFGDHSLFEWSHTLISGHTLKHLFAALVAWPVISMLNTAAKQTARRGVDGHEQGIRKQRGNATDAARWQRLTDWFLHQRKRLATGWCAR